MSTSKLGASAHAAVESDKFPYYKIKYERIYKSRGKKISIMSIAKIKKAVKEAVNFLIAHGLIKTSDISIEESNQ